MDKKFTLARLALAILSTSLEETAIWAIWRFVLPDFGINWPNLFLVIVMVAWGGFSVWLFALTTRTLRRQRQAGLPSMVGTRGRVVAALNPEGLVKIRSELWGAASDNGENIAVGQEVLVVAEDGLKLLVRKSDGVTAKR